MEWKGKSDRYEEGTTEFKGDDLGVDRGITSGEEVLPRPKREGPARELKERNKGGYPKEVGADGPGCTSRARSCAVKDGEWKEVNRDDERGGDAERRRFCK